MSYVGIVLISHSVKVVEGIHELVRQVEKNVPIEIAGGTDDLEIGTSVEKIQNAIEKAYSDKGVVILFDLGSAIMNAELALEITGYENVKIADAPLLEGSYVAAVEAGMGKTLEEVVKTAEETRTSNKIHS
ncbi:dihydroxyacetone kinase phosphoryl donor subunit DhaM [Salirhabdus salicampi]|uniref:dihydroxyacetone kinase phosphoryl donor subunit DhaM n=1 Tax=Salirhabdus salicampi TaxID=476102 RepID=UPI0020C314DC|nr:dihydroxyacetone kinase phosphoryl donor subunit DhaM [Salirhabdus salicampi]MCP8615449.1 dihydroxyacetone kinase phosphoryl donor subunit DhaM [Salirhabdus salicampi]